MYYFTIDIDTTDLSVFTERVQSYIIIIVCIIQNILVIFTLKLIFVI